MDTESSTVARSGTIKWFDSEKGFGFIEQENGEDIFVHKSQIQELLTEGTKVLYELVETEKGLRARNVRIVFSASFAESEEE